MISSSGIRQLIRYKRLRRSAVQKHALPWQQVRSEDGTTEVIFGVKGYPHKVIISPEGKVLKIMTGENDDFYHLLDETLK
jgi:hypothetical protein